MVTIPSTILGLFLACLFVNKMGKELKDDPEYQRRLNDPKICRYFASTTLVKEVEVSKTAKISVSLFLFGALLVVLMGAALFDPCFDGKPMGMAHTIEIIMLSIGALIILTCKPDGTAITKGSVFHAGMRAVIAIFGIAWLGDTLMQAHITEVKEMVKGLVETAPWAFALRYLYFQY